MGNKRSIFSARWLAGVILLSFFSGASAWASLDAFPSWISFGETAVGSSAGRTVTVFNRSPYVVYNPMFSTWGDTWHFYLWNGNCWSIPAYGSCTIRVEYSPRHAGLHRMTITVNGPTGRTWIDVDGRAYVPDPWDRPEN